MKIQTLCLHVAFFSCLLRQWKEYPRIHERMYPMIYQEQTALRILWAFYDCHKYQPKSDFYFHPYRVGHIHPVGYKETVCFPSGPGAVPACCSDERIMNLLTLHHSSLGQVYAKKKKRLPTVARVCKVALEVRLVRHFQKLVGWQRLNTERICWCPYPSGAARTTGGDLTLGSWSCPSLVRL